MPALDQSHPATVVSSAKDPGAAVSATPNRRVVATALSVLFGAAVLRTAWIVDDAYITFRTIDNFWHGFGLRWNVAERVQVYTHPLWLALMAAFYGVTREPYFTSLALSLALGVVTMYVLTSRVALDEAAAAGAAAVLIMSKACLDFSTSGLETPLTNLLLTLFFAAYFAGSSLKHLRLQAVLTGLLALTDATAVWLVVPSLAVRVSASGWRRNLKTLAIGAAPLVAWELFAIIYYGFPLGNPTYARLRANVLQSYLTRHGWLYLLDSINLDPITLTAIVAAGTLALVGMATRARPVCMGILIYLIATVRAGGDVMSGRLLAPPLVCAAIILSRLDLSTVGAIARGQLLVVIVGLGLVAPRPALSIAPPANPGLLVNDASGITDERPAFFFNTGLINARRDVPWPSDPGVMGGRRPRRTRPEVVVSRALGMNGFFSGQAVHIIDPTGIADPLLARLPAPRPWYIGPLRRTLPAGYEETVASGTNRLSSPAIASLYEDLVTVTRDPIWSRRRFSSILRLNFHAPAIPVEMPR